MLPHTNQDTSSAIESYHATLKSRFLCGKKYLWGHRIDWLVHKLMYACLPYFWYLGEAKKSGFIRNTTIQRFIEPSLEKAQSIPNVYVQFFKEGTSIIAKVKSQSLGTKHYTMFNADCDWACCDCTWAEKGNMCKH